MKPGEDPSTPRKGIAPAQSQGLPDTDAAPSSPSGSGAGAGTGSEIAALRERNKHLELALRAAGVGTWNWDLRTNELTWDEVLHRLFGLKADEFHGRYEQFLEMLHPGDRERVRREALDSIERDAEYDASFQVMWRDGSAHYLESRGRVYRDEKGEATTMAGVCWDVTDQKKADQELRHAWRFVDSIVENVPSMLFVKNATDLRIVRWNKANEEVIGYSEEEVIGKNDYDFFPKNEADFFTSKDREVLREGKLVDIQEEMIHTQKHGTRILHTKKIPLLDEFGNPQYLLGISEDITERKQFEEALRRSEERFFLAVKGSSDGIWDWNVETNEVYYSPRFKALLGHREADFPNVFSSFESSLHPDDTAPVLRAIHDHLEDRKPYDIQYRLRTHNQGYRWFRARGQALWNEDGKPVRMAGSITDITDAKESEAALRRARDELELRVEQRTRELVESNKALQLEISERKRAANELREKAAELSRSNTELQQFAYVASHDLQEPLRMVASYVQLLERRYRDKLDADANEFIGFAVDGANRMKNLINDLLNYSRVSTHGKELSPVQCDDAVRTAMANLEVAIQESRTRVQIDPLPSVLGDQGQLVRLFQNLIGNAIKFRGNRPPEIRVFARLEDPFWEFRVQDNGIGIDPAFFDRIFVIFQRLHGKDEYAGTGIGLAVCRKIVERHGGQIGVESSVNEGATFRFTLPVVKPIEPTEPVDSEATT